MEAETRVLHQQAKCLSPFRLLKQIPDQVACKQYKFISQFQRLEVQAEDASMASEGALSDLRLLTRWSPYNLPKVPIP